MTATEKPRKRIAGPERAAGSRHPIPIAWSLLPGLVALMTYLLLTPGAPGDGDSSELTLVLGLDGIAHPTGYPLYTLFGSGFVHALHALGVGWAYAANVWSALGGAVAVILMHALATRFVRPEIGLGRGSWFLVGLLPVLFFAFNPAWTDVTTVSEVYSWHLALVCGACVFFVDIVRRLAGREEMSKTRLRWSAAAWGLLCGVGLAHHVTAIWILTPLSLGILWALRKWGRLRGELIGLALAAALLPLSSYALLYFRAQHHGPANWATLEPTAGSLFRHTTGTMYRYMLGRFAPSPEQQLALDRDIYPFLFPALALLPAVVLLGRGTRERIVLGGPAAAAFIGTAFSFMYGVYDPVPQFLAPLALGLAVVTPVVAGLLAGGPGRRRAGQVVTAALALAAALLLVPWLRWGAERQRRHLAHDAFIHARWASIPADSGMVFWSADEYQRLNVYEFLGGEKPGLDVINTILLTNTLPRERFIRRHGFDPLLGVPRPQRNDDPVEVASYFDTLYQSINRRARLPVILFDPLYQLGTGRSVSGDQDTKEPVRILPKGQDALSAGGS